MSYAHVTSVPSTRSGEMLTSCVQTLQQIISVIKCTPAAGLAAEHRTRLLPLPVSVPLRKAADVGVRADARGHRGRPPGMLATIRYDRQLLSRQTPVSSPRTLRRTSRSASTQVPNARDEPQQKWSYSLRWMCCSHVMVHAARNSSVRSVACSISPCPSHAARTGAAQHSSCSAAQLCSRCAHASTICAP